MTSMPVTVQERIPMPLGPLVRPEGAAGGMSIGDVIRILKQRMFLILFVWLFFVALTVAGTLVWVTKWPSYSATGAVYVESPFPKIPMENERMLLPVELLDRYVADQAVRVKEEGLLQEALQDDAIRHTDWYKSEKDETRFTDLKDELSVRQVPQTSYLAVSFSTRNKQDAPVIVNTIIDRYLAKMATQSRTRAEVELSDYEKTDRTMQDQLDSIRRKKEDFITSKLGVAGATQEHGLNVVGERYRALMEEVTKLEAEKLQYRAQYENLLGLEPSQIAIPPQMQAQIDLDPEVSGLQTAKVMREQDLLIAEKTLGDKHRDLRDVRTQLDAIEQQLTKVKAEKEQAVREAQINQAQTMYLNATQAELQVREVMLDAEAQQRDLDRGLAQFHSLEEEQKLFEEQLTRVRDYTNQLRMIVSASGGVRVQRGSMAFEPKERSQPRWQYNIPAGVVLGLLLGVGLAMLLEFVDTSLKTGRDIVRHMHVPVLGTVPDLDDEEVAIDSIEMAAQTAPRSMIAEAFRNIRTNLLLSSPAEQQRSLLITSPKPEDGKTAVAVNLAISLAQSGRRVLLVDANFHRPRLHALFPKASREGLSNILVGQARLENLASRTDLPNLDVLTTGPIPPNPTELLAGPYLQSVISQATERYDQIIFDGPPVLLVSDVLVMSGSVDGAILVCRAKACSRGVAQRARDQLERVEAHIFGAVLNAAQVTRGGYFREQIRTYYDYQSEEALGADRLPILPEEQQPDAQKGGSDKA
jgi:polysaccharide biosynthesis transport protein